MISLSQLLPHPGLVHIVGASANGKTTTAVHLATQVPGLIILDTKSGDQQVEAMRSQTRFVDLQPPQDRDYDLDTFERDLTSLIEESSAQVLLVDDVEYIMPRSQIDTIIPVGSVIARMQKVAVATHCRIIAATSIRMPLETSHGDVEKVTSIPTGADVTVFCSRSGDAINLQIESESDVTTASLPLPVF